MVANDTAAARFIETLSPVQAEAFFRCIEESTFGGMLGWVYGTGFPKSHDVPKAIEAHRFHEWLDAHPDQQARYRRLNAWAKKRDKRKISKGLRGRIEAAFRRKAGVIGDVIGQEIIINDMRNSATLKVAKDENRPEYTRDITAYTLPEAAEYHGFGTALKPAWEPICLARKPLIGTVAENVLAYGTGGINVGGCKIEAEKVTGWGDKAAGGGTWNENNSRLTKDGAPRPSEGRYPANVLTDGSAEVLSSFPVRKDEEPASRFFYSAKADGNDRLGSDHPTVKPVDLMRWLVRLVCPKGGTVLDPFAGTGTTGEAAFWEGCKSILIERESKFQRDIAKRMGLILAGPDERKRARTEAAPVNALPLFGDSTVAHVAEINATAAIAAE